MEYKEAVSCLLDYAGYIKLDTPSRLQKNEWKKKESRNRPEAPEKAPFILPEKARNNRGLYAYLMKRRKLSQETINYWLKKDLMYESEPYHNIVFLGKNAEGEVKFASQRGIRDAYGKPFKGDVPGNDKAYGVNLVCPESQEINVYEAAIDAMSDMDFRKDFETSILALGMVSDGPLQTILGEHPNIKSMNFCLDNDLPGRTAAKKLARKYVLDGYEVYLRLPPFGKDHNFFLQCERENRTLWKQLSQSERRPKKSVQEPERLEEKERRFLYLPEGAARKKQASSSSTDMMRHTAISR